MSNYLNSLKKQLLKEGGEPEDNFDLVEDELELDEMSCSGGAGGYETPNAFGEVDNDTVELLGYKKATKKKTNVKDSEFKKMSRELFVNEVAYQTYKKDPTATPKAKVNNSIMSIHKKLREIEQVINHNVRLKNEAGVNNSQYWKSSRENITKISERLLRVSKQLKELAS